MPKLARSYKDLLKEALHKFQEAHGGQPYEMIHVVEWAVQKGLLEYPSRNPKKLLEQELRRAAREDYVTDPQGRRVRRNHARRVLIDGPDGESVQKVFWDDIYSARPEHMRVATGQRRDGIFHDCKQLKTDIDSYNDNNVHGAHLEADFNFNDDLIESELEPTYPESRPDGDDPLADLEDEN